MLIGRVLLVHFRIFEFSVFPFFLLHSMMDLFRPVGATRATLKMQMFGPRIVLFALKFVLELLLELVPEIYYRPAF